MSVSKNNFLDFIAVEIEGFYGVIIPDHTKENQIAYTLFTSFLTIFQKKLYVYFLSGKTINYQIHYFIFNFKII